MKTKRAHPERILVVVEMTGGNDGLNTVLPFRNDVLLQSPADDRAKEGERSQGAEG